MKANFIRFLVLALSVGCLGTLSVAQQDPPQEANGGNSTGNQIRRAQSTAASEAYRQSYDQAQAAALEDEGEEEEESGCCG